MKRLVDNGGNNVDDVLRADRRALSLHSDPQLYSIKQHREIAVAFSVVGIATVVTLTVCLYRCRNRSRQRSVDDPELGNGLSSERGQLVAVQAPPPVPDLCPYSPQTGELASVGQSPTEQYAAECRAMRGAGTGHQKTFDVGGRSGSRCAEAEVREDLGGTDSENPEADTRHPICADCLSSPTHQDLEFEEISQSGTASASESVSFSPSRSYAAKTLTTHIDDDNDDDDDDDEEEREGDEEEDAEMMEITEANNNISDITTTGNNNNDEPDQHVTDDSEERIISTSTTSAESSSKDNGNESEDSTAGSVLELSLGYDTKHSTLIVSVVAVRRFHALVHGGDHGPGSIASPYVRLQLILRDGRRLKAKTCVVRTVAGDERAEFGETFAFRDLATGLPGTRLHAAVLGFDRFSRDAVLGEVTLPLDDNHLLSALIDRRGVLETVELNIEPTPQTQSPITKVGRQASTMSARGRVGELLVSTGHQPGAVDKLTVVVLKARNLPSNSDVINGCPGYSLTEVYVKVYMLYKGRRVSRKQTRVVACGLVAPSVAVFNEAFLFDVDPHQSLTDTTVELALVDRHRVTKDEYVGKLVVSPFDGDEWGRPPGDAAGVRGSLDGVGGGEHQPVGGNDRPVAVWHRLCA